LINPFKKPLAQNRFFNSQRISRTEITRAYKEGVNVEVWSDPDAIGYNSSLSSRHPETDKCDIYANADLYGMGKGNYPRNQGPSYPYHPHCTCVLTPLFLGEEKRKLNPKAGEDFLKKIPEKSRIDILGLRNERDFQDDPKRWREFVKFELESKRPKIPERFFVTPEEEG